MALYGDKDAPLHSQTSAQPKQTTHNLRHAREQDGVHPVVASSRTQDGAGYRCTRQLARQLAGEEEPRERSPGGRRTKRGLSVINN